MGRVLNLLQKVPFLYEAQASDVDHRQRRPDIPKGETAPGIGKTYVPGWVNQLTTRGLGGAGTGLLRLARRRLTWDFLRLHHCFLDEQILDPCLSIDVIEIEGVFLALHFTNLLLPASC